MEEWELPDELQRALQADFSAGTEAFRDALLERCLAVLNADRDDELTDGDLELLAAAGDPTANAPGFDDNEDR